MSRFKNRPEALALLLIFAILVSGCSGSSGKKGNGNGKQDVPDTAPTGEFGSDTCSIEGTVVDDEAQILVGAEVGLFGEADVPSVKTAQDGGFSFSNLPPKTYVVSATKVGYETATARVNCAADSKANVQLALTPLVTSDIGYSIIYPVQSGVIACAAGFPVGSTDDLGSLCSSLPGSEQGSSSIRYKRDAFNITGMVFEMSWTSANPTLGGKWLQLDFTAIQNPGNITFTTDDLLDDTGEPDLPDAQGYDAATIHGTSPINLRAEAKAGSTVYSTSYDHAKEPLFEAGATGNNDGDQYSGVVQNQRFDLYMAFFYNGAPIPAKFTMLG